MTQQAAFSKERVRSNRRIRSYFYNPDAKSDYSPIKKHQQPSHSSRNRIISTTTRPRSDHHNMTSSMQEAQASDHDSSSSLRSMVTDSPFHHVLQSSPRIPYGKRKKATLIILHDQYELFGMDADAIQTMFQSPDSLPPPSTNENVMVKDNHLVITDVPPLKDASFIENTTTESVTHSSSIILRSVDTSWTHCVKERIASCTASSTKIPIKMIHEHYTSLPLLHDGCSSHPILDRRSNNVAKDCEYHHHQDEMIGADGIPQISSPMHASFMHCITKCCTFFENYVDIIHPFFEILYMAEREDRPTPHGEKQVIASLSHIVQKTIIPLYTPLAGNMYKDLTVGTNPGDAIPVHGDAYITRCHQVPLHLRDVILARDNKDWNSTVIESSVILSAYVEHKKRMAACTTATTIQSQTKMNNTMSSRVPITLFPAPYSISPPLPLSAFRIVPQSLTTKCPIIPLHCKVPKMIMAVIVIL